MSAALNMTNPGMLPEKHRRGVCALLRRRGDRSSIGRTTNTEHKAKTQRNSGT